MHVENSIYNNTEQIVLVVASIVSGSLSLLGSSIILRIIVSDFRNKIEHVYHRLLFVMSIIDIVSSLNAIVSFSMVPRGFFWGAAGNTLTCNISGSVFEVGTSVGMYNLGLSLYYYLSLRAKKNQRYISTYVEPFIHIVCLIVPIGFAVWAWVSEAMNPLRGVGGWCYIYKFPPRCSEIGDIECTRGSNWFLIAAVTMLGKGLPVWLGIVFTMTLLWCYVRAQERTVERYRTHSETDRTRQAFQQAMMYIFAYFFTYIFSLVNLFLPTDAVRLNFYVAVMVKLTVPLQGLFNFFIYIKPRIYSMRERSEYRDRPVLELIHIIITRRRDNVPTSERRPRRDSFIFPAFQASRASLHFQLARRSSARNYTSSKASVSSTKDLTLQEERLHSKAVAELGSCDSDDVSEDFDEYAQKLVEMLQRRDHTVLKDCSDNQSETSCTNLDEDEQKGEEIA